MLTNLVDWNNFEALLECDTDNMSFLHSHPLDTYRTLCDALLTALKNSGDKVSDSYSTKSPPSSSVWWNRNRFVALNKKRKAFRNFVDNPSLPNLQNYLLLSKNAKKIIHKSKSKSFKHFCESLDLHTDVGSAWRKIKAFKNHKLSFTSALSPTEKSNVMAAFEKVIPSHSINNTSI